MVHFCDCSKPACNGICERCYNTTDSCTRCIACNSNELEGCSPKEESSSSLGIEQYCGPECTATGKETNPSLFNFCGKESIIRGAGGEGSLVMVYTLTHLIPRVAHVY